jgi:hypothetical protein
MNTLGQYQKESIQKEIDRIQDSEPGLTFTDAWKRLRKKRPDLFAYTRPSTPASYQPSPQHARAEKISRAQRLIKAALTELQKEEGLSFTEAWNTLKEHRPELFESLVEAADPGAPDYIMLRAEDADLLEREVAAGLWKD